MKKIPSTTQLVVMAGLIALEMILTRFLSINTPIVRLGFGFLPVAINAMLYGPLWAGTCYAIGDVLGAILFPTTGAYFPGFTLTAFLSGIVFGLILHRHPITWIRALMAAALVCVILNLGMDTLWLTILMGKGVFALLPARLIKVAIMIPVETILIVVTGKQLLPRIKNGAVTPAP